MHTTSAASAGALARNAAGAARHKASPATARPRWPDRALPARASGGVRLALSAFQHDASRRHQARWVVARNTEESKEAEKSEEAEASSGEPVSEQEETDSTSGGHTESSDSDAEPEVTGYAALVASLRSALDEGRTDDLGPGLAAVEEEFLGMTEQVNEAKAMAKSQEAIALAAKEQYLRSTADFDNFRKRSAAEKNALRDSVRGDVVKEFLPLVDNFELAGKQLKLETEGEQRVDSAYQALYRQMVDIFKALGVRPVDTVGTQFNPEVHEAIMQEPSDEVEDGAVLEEFRRGFVIGEKLLRPAMVKVAINEGSTPTASADAPAEEEAVDVEAEEPAAETESKSTETKKEA
mmetsp:Transcript_22511/g.62443  ORF Transcript_22511/g.62443 Transcript_22511/m.62443 type:complete len:351 (+) Transcript_22511:270-1322(+)|eukprot:CAMPEP_0117662790 /NCGR_PEP_ID=MMETSP0804-20121206/8238_1 /TAXON_ID=1074897 /ORGANISM="Tetraselmis astigmatica, Strain CCMP880" /LENGTH=350 /DNA_ID=CAMNT_0005469707 /DNA_START=237 /DNA_END=1289 /DNA_ORIENTATION=+